MRAQEEARQWAWEQFGGARLGDERRRRRLVAMAQQVARRPGAAVSKVFESDADRQAAYDFLEGVKSAPGPIQRALSEGCARDAARSAFAFVPVDGMTLSLSDGQRTKGLGPVGGSGRGIKVINAVAVDPTGVPLGVAGQRYWVRPERPRRSRKESRRQSDMRLASEKETSHWVDVIESVTADFDDHHASAWFVLDREADAAPLLEPLARSGHRFTVRASSDRVVQTVDGRSGLKAWMQRQAVCGQYEVSVPARARRAARRACMHVRISQVALCLRIEQTRYERLLPVYVVWVREVGTTPDGEQPLDWLLLTNVTVDDLHSANLVVFSYTQRWSIEEMHKTWKSGLCGIEQSQLRSRDALIKWAIILAAVAVRVERLKQRSREQPDVPATEELSPREIRALILLKRDQKKRTETVPDSVPPLAVAVRWIADLGGYTGKSSGGPPGSITIARGLERVRDAAKLLGLLDAGRGHT